MTDFEELKEKCGFGWLPDYPDFRDYTPGTEQIARLLAASKRTERLATSDVRELAPTISTSYDLRSWFSPVDVQGNLGSCTAHAADSIMEYSERRAFGTYTDISRLFVYKVTRDLLGLVGDVGASIRGTMGTLALVGAPPERYWPYAVQKFDEEPPVLAFELAEHYRATAYLRLDVDQKGAPIPRDQLLLLIKAWTTIGFPPMFGFRVWSSYMQSWTNGGRFPFPAPGEAPTPYGHAVAVAGFDDSLKIKNASPGATETVGALCIKNSWGTGWGEQGYGWLPYEYVLRGQAVDWWALLKSTWIETDKFGF